MLFGLMERRSPRSLRTRVARDVTWQPCLREQDHVVDLQGRLRRTRKSALYRARRFKRSVCCSCPKRGGWSTNDATRRYVGHRACGRAHRDRRQSRRAVAQVSVALRNPWFSYPRLADCVLNEISAMPVARSIERKGALQRRSTASAFRSIWSRGSATACNKGLFNESILRAYGRRERYPDPSSHSGFGRSFLDRYQRCVLKRGSRPTRVSPADRCV